MSKDGCVISLFNWSESGRTDKDWEQLGTQTPACHDSHTHMRMWEGRQVGGQKDNGLGSFAFLLDCATSGIEVKSQCPQSW